MQVEKLRATSLAQKEPWMLADAEYLVDTRPTLTEEELRAFWYAQLWRSRYKETTGAAWRHLWRIHLMYGVTLRDVCDASLWWRDSKILWRVDEPYYQQLRQTGSLQFLDRTEDPRP